MSKSKKIQLILNLLFQIMVLIARLFILSDSPPEKDVQWSEEGIISSYNLFKNYGI